MPIYFSDLVPMMGRCWEALDKGKSITLKTLRERIENGELRELLNEAGNYPSPEIPDTDYQEIAEAIKDRLQASLGEEGEHYYASRNGYALLIALLVDIQSKGGTADNKRPYPKNPPRNKSVEDTDDK